MPPQDTFYDFLNPPIGGAHESIDGLIDEYPIPTIHWSDKYKNWKEGWLEREEELEMERPTKERELMSADALKDLFNMMRPAIEEIYEGMGYEDTGEAFDSLLSKVGSGTILSYLTDRKDPALKSEYEDESLKKLRTAGRFNPAGGIIGKGKEGGHQYVPLGTSFLTREDPDTVFAGNTIQNIMPAMGQSEGYGVDFVGPMPRYGKSSKQHESKIMKENLRTLLHEQRHIDPITGDILPHYFAASPYTGLQFNEESDKIIMDMLSELIGSSEGYQSLFGEVPEKLDIQKIYKELGY